MAGDWIKMRGNLWDDPRVAKLCDLTDCGEAQIIGGLYWLWATADQHTEDGIMPGLSLRQIDRKTAVPGFGEALCAIGWLADHPEGVRITNFEEHNGQSAKRRAADAQRKSTVRNVSASDADNVRTSCGGSAELEKEKEKEKEKKREEQTAEPAPANAKAATQRATRLPADWQPSDEEIAFCQTERPDLHVGKTAASFRDYWLGVSGGKGCKLDWSATWRNWVRNEKPQARASPAGYESPKDRSRREAAEQLTGRSRHADRPEFVDLN
jgi:hypothetical protein